VRDAVERFKSGAFQAAPQPSVEAHFGMGGGRGHGMGGGRGMGRGMEMGGGGMGMGAGMAPMPPPAPYPVDPQSEIEALKGQAQVMKRQLDDILHRIKELEEKNR